MRPRALLRLYPRAWRERYGDEFVDACGDRSLSFQQAIDIVCGAIDARVSPQSHLAAASGSTGGKNMSAYLKTICMRPAPKMTTADGLKGAAVMIVASFAMLAVSSALKREGMLAEAKVFTSLSVPMSTLLMSHFLFLRGQSPIAKTIITGGTLAILSIFGVISLLY